MNWQTRLPKQEQHFPSPSKDKAYRYTTWRRNLSHNSLFCQIPSVSSEELAFPVSLAVNCPDFAATVTPRSQPSFVFLSMQDKAEKNSSCGYHLQDLSHLPLDCSASEPLGAPYLASLLPFLTSSPDLGVWLDCWVSVEFFRTPILRKRSDSTTITTNV